MESASNVADALQKLRGPRQSVTFREMIDRVVQRHQHVQRGIHRDRVQEHHVGRRAAGPLRAQLVEVRFERLELRLDLDVRIFRLEGGDDLVVLM